MSKHKKKKHRRKPQNNNKMQVQSQKKSLTTEFWVTMGLAAVAIVVGVIIGLSI